MNSLCFAGLHKSFGKFIKQNNLRLTLELQPLVQTILPSRNTFILKRKYPVKLVKKGVEYRKFKARDYLYEHVEFRDVKKKPDVTVILKEYIEGYGQKGDCITVKRNTAYNELLLPGLADYATPEAIEKAKEAKKANLKDEFSSLYAPMTVKFLENMRLSVLMNKDVEWTLEPWHVKVAFRKAGVHVPEKCITLPPKSICGPNLDLQGKTFCITVTINNKEKATVRCLLHHWTPNIAERIPYVDSPWALPPSYMFPEDEEKIQKLPVIKYKRSNSIENVK